MSVFLGQLPPAEIARLKAELAETLIAHFCYPRFFDHRVESLRTRPVDRAKRQEVWLYLSSVDFTAWNRVDLMSPDFQHRIERLFIHFVQRNRSFFGEQGRKRMSDIRMLISSSASSVAQGLRGHLTGHHQNNPPFGSPRPVTSWATRSGSGCPEPSWEQIAASTMLLQQQLQEVRGEIKPAVQIEARPTTTPPRRTDRVQTTIPAAKDIEPEAPKVLAGKSALPSTSHSEAPLSNPKSAAPVNAVLNALPASVPAPIHKGEAIITSVETPKVSPSVPPPKSKEVAIPQSPLAEKVQSAVMPQSPIPEKVQGPLTSATVQPHGLPPPASVMVAGQGKNITVPSSEEDMAIFEQMRHQLIIWLRIEAIHFGMDIAGHGPSQLLELLRQQDNFDETRLQIVSTLLNLSNQVIKNGQASPFDYKQALMFHLMHTRR